MEACYSIKHNPPKCFCRTS